MFFSLNPELLKPTLMVVYYINSDSDFQEEWVVNVLRSVIHSYWQDSRIQSTQFSHFPHVAIEM